MRINAMKNSQNNQLFPEEKELEKKSGELVDLEFKVVHAELGLATLQAELNAFQRQYLRIVGIKLAELDEIIAQITEIRARRNPNDNDAEVLASKARAKAQESTRATDELHETSEAEDHFSPSESLKKQYREIAKQIHPDLSNDEKDRERRNSFMARVNAAYKECDENGLKLLLDEWESSPESVIGEGIGLELVRIIRKIAQVQRRIISIEEELINLNQSSLGQLRLKVVEVSRIGRDLLAEMAEQIEEEILKIPVVNRLRAQRS